MPRLRPLQRAYWMGFRRAKAQMRRELDEMARRFDDEITRLNAEMRAKREQMARNFDDAIDGVRAEMQAARAEFHRYQAIEHAIDIERDPNMLLN